MTRNEQIGVFLLCIFFIGTLVIFPMYATYYSFPNVLLRKGITIVYCHDSPIAVAERENLEIVLFGETLAMAEQLIQDHQVSLIYRFNDYDIKSGVSESYYFIDGGELFCMNFMVYS